MSLHRDEINHLRAAIKALDAQRSTLGDHAVDASLKTLNEKIAKLTEAETSLQSTEGERRRASILFSDLSGYTLMNEKLDPEVVQGFMNQIKKEAIRIVEKYEGTVNQFVGDEVIALFGIPLSHEDDPIRAIKVANEFHQFVDKLSKELEPLIGQPVALHSSIHTGLIVTEPKDGLDGKFSLTGDTVNTGARLRDQASAGDILISAETQALIAPYYRTESLDPVSMKGKEFPVVPFRILGKTKVQNRIEASEKKGFTPLIGRRKELAILGDCLAKTMKGQGQLITIKGNAGLGKSRLIYEFRHEIDRSKVTILQGNCQSYGAAMPYLPFLDAIRRGLHLHKEEANADLHSKAVKNILDIDPNLEKHIPVILHLLSIPTNKYPLPKELTGEQLKLHIQEALIEINLLNTRRQPMLAILEDWHWADSGSDIALQQLVQALKDYPILLIVAYRPEYSPSWGKVPYHTEINLTTVDESSIGAMIKAIYKVPGVATDFSKQIHKLSGGNPFFIEELCSLLKENGSIAIQNHQLVFNEDIAKINYPETVQAVIRSKLDRLEGEPKKILRLASVLGREFPLKVLERLTDKGDDLELSLKKLRSTDFIREINVPSEIIYQFNHVITQEVTYNSLLIKRRKELHKLAAQSLKDLFKYRLEEQYEALAFHYSKSEDWANALVYMELAGDKASINYSLEEARNYYSEAIALIDSHLENRNELNRTLKRKRVQISVKWAQLSHYAGSEETTKVLTSSLELANELKNDVMTAHVNYWLAQRSIVIGKLPEAVKYFTNCIEMAKSSAENKLLAQANSALGRIHFFGAEYLAAKDFLETSIPLLDEYGELDDVAYAKAFLCGCYSYTGDFKKGLQFGRDAISIAKDTGNLSRLAATYVLVAAGYERQGDWKEAISISNDTIKIAKSLGDVMSLCFGLFTLGYCKHMEGDQEAGVIQMNKAIDLMETSKIFHLFPLFYGFVSYIYARGERWNESKEAANKCLKWAASYTGFMGMPYMALGMVEAKLSPLNPAISDQHFKKALELAEKKGQTPLLTQCSFEYAKILLERGDASNGKFYLESAKVRFTELDMPWWLHQAKELEKRLV